MSLALAAQTETLVFLAELTKILFVFAYGACVGSLTNVLVYRLPLGMGVVVPSSACPICRHTLSWKDNIPVLGWLALRGRCRYCRTPISPEYPLVEAFVGLLFVLFYLLWFGFDQLAGPLSTSTMFLGLDLGLVQPEWASNGLGRTWPLFVMLLILVGSLVAMTIVDAKTFMIPLVLAWTPAVVGVVGHLGQAVLEANTRAGWMWEPTWSYAIPTPGRTGWPWVGVAVGGTAGIVLSLVLVRVGLLKRSFADYDQWEADERDRRGLPPAPSSDPREAPTPGSAASPEPAEETDSEAAPVPAPESSSESAPGPKPWPESIKRSTRRWLLIGSATVIAAALGGIVASMLGVLPAIGALIGALVGPIPGGLLANALAPVPEPDADESGDESPTDLWLEYPHARREMFRELLFIGPAIALGLIGASVASQIGGPWTTDAVSLQPVPTDLVPRWLEILSGSLLGYLIGGGVVWAIRILGSLLFRKEAMGLGDVHLMAGVGACLGWIDPALAFFIAAPIGLYIELLRRVITGGRRAAMPFGPSLAIAVIVVLLAKPWISEALTAWMHRPIHLP